MVAMTVPLCCRNSSITHCVTAIIHCDEDKLLLYWKHKSWDKPISPFSSLYCCSWMSSIAITWIYYCQFLHSFIMHSHQHTVTECEVGIVRQSSHTDRRTDIKNFGTWNVRIDQTNGRLEASSSRFDTSRRRRTNNNNLLPYLPNYTIQYSTKQSYHTNNINPNHTIKKLNDVLTKSFVCRCRRQ